MPADGAAGAHAGSFVSKPQPHACWWCCWGPYGSLVSALQPIAVQGTKAGVWDAASCPCVSARAHGRMNAWAHMHIHACRVPLLVMSMPFVSMRASGCCAC
eukprot:365338-Chlamydomonas_euryale.AAC.26